MNYSPRFALSTCLLALAPTLATAQKFDPPATKQPDEQTMLLIQHRTVKLRDAIQALPQSTPAHVRPDVEIYLKAAEWIVRHGEWYHADAGKWTLGTLDQGLARATEAASGHASWLDPKGKVVARAYRSRVDGSVQPYAVTYPAGYTADAAKKWRLDIVLHGRDGSISEAKFLFQHNGKNAPKDQDFVKIDIYGRGNNAYRWAGETDVFEALENFIAVEKLLGRDSIDRRRIVLRGFSMGGAGTWHLGLQHPDQFCVMGPGAGFTTTHSYVKSLPAKLPPYQEPLLHIYDAVAYAANAADVPIVAYSGEKDDQKAAADNIEKRLKELKIDSMTHLIGPGLKHEFPAEWQKKAEAEYVKFAGPNKGRPKYPQKISFSTYTLKFSMCDWIHIRELEQHYSLAKIDAQRDGDALKISTKNVTFFEVTLPDKGKDSYRTIVIDGKECPKSEIGKYRKHNGAWVTPRVPPIAGMTKQPGLQGPIDDAFTSAFLCVKGTGKSWHAETSTAVDAQLIRFEKEWDRWMRGKLPIKSDNDVTEADIETKNLILFGDPSSNSLIAKVLPKLPLTWDKSQITIGGQKYESEKHLPMLICPNPLYPFRYVVLNSGHTFHDAEFKGTNALLFPHLGDFAVVRPVPTAKEPAAFEVMKSGIFDETWKVNER